MYILIVVQNVHFCVTHMTLRALFHMQKGVCMREENATSIEYFKDPRRIVDLLNGIVFQGRQIITTDNLVEKNPVIHNVYKKNNKVVAIENTPDLSIMMAWKNLKFLFMIQIQTLEHYAMPVRLLHEKGTDYYNQWKKLQKEHKNCDDLKDSPEWLSGMKKTDHFYPVLQIVVYLGKEHWQAAFQMDDLTRTRFFPEELRKLFAEKPMLLFEVYHFKNIEWFQTDLRQVCGFLQRTNDKTALQEYVKENEAVFSRLEEDTFDLLTVMSGIRAMKLIKRDVESVGGGFDMCKAFDDMMRDSKREGKREGKREAEEQMSKLIQKLISAGRITDLQQASSNKKYRKKLMAELGIA